MQVLRQALFGAILLLASFSQLYADPVLATYTFTGSPGDQVSETVDIDPVGAAFSDIVRGPGVVANAGLNSINSRSWSQGALDPDDYYAFSVAPDAGHSVSLSQIDFTNVGRARGFHRRSIEPDVSRVRSTCRRFGHTYNRRHSVILNAAFAGLIAPVGSASLATRQKARWGHGAWVSRRTTASICHRTCSTGTVAVPEPTSLLLMGTAALGLLGGDAGI
jgi:hypothetical protein